jgi:hypothetical protein
MDHLAGGFGGSAGARITITAHAIVPATPIHFEELPGIKVTEDNIAHFPDMEIAREGQGDIAELFAKEKKLFPKKEPKKEPIRRDNADWDF